MKYTIYVDYIALIYLICIFIQLWIINYHNYTHTDDPDVVKSRKELLKRTGGCDDSKLTDQIKESCISLPIYAGVLVLCMVINIYYYYYYYI